ncbi:MauE/DoxX family redox-associated membrane protein [Streptomyces sp. SID13031]|uniref:MauE/DoxX family redox-associated membrane protein n=1 Tax=Streptomyces sp. SID13031 TaxID=2706046 RepID=UPI0013C9CF5F|nr:MauE/DoxX family redox-associated membrane protein [Streptomyces sp. SID13031]NEA31287.1 hypothetical protein [Streptomyces sp. SID13031]
MTGTSMALIALLGTVFAASAYGKVRSTVAWRSFAFSLRPLLPARWVRPVAVLLPATEVGLTAAMFWAIAGGLAKLPGTLAVVQWAALAAAVLLAILTAGVAIAVARDSKVACACFGASNRPLGRLHVARNSALVVIAVLASTVSGQASSPGGLLVGLVAGAIGALLIIRLEDLAELFHPAPA